MLNNLMVENLKAAFWNALLALFQLAFVSLSRRTFELHRPLPHIRKQLQ